MCLSGLFWDLGAQQEMVFSVGDMIPYNMLFLMNQ